MARRAEPKGTLILPSVTELNAMAEQSPWIVKTNAARFQADVLERSKQVPVVVDFWAPWCGPCRMLGPILEKLAREKSGAFVLAKVNTDEDPSLAAAFGVEGIPAVFAIRDGRPIDQFVGALPESQIRAWLDGILPAEDEMRSEAARALAAEDAAAAEAALRAILAEFPKSTAARRVLAELLFASGRLNEAEPLLEELTEMGAADEDCERMLSEIRLQESARTQGDPAELQARLQADPDDFAAALALAEIEAAKREYAAALEHALHVVARDRGDLRESARGLMLRLFNVLGNDHPLTEEYRRKLTMLLF
ncbi:MAG: thioredoxin [Thermogutta sp.]|nr:thioredoxin [Thermogutta sp.]